MRSIFGLLEGLRWLASSFWDFRNYSPTSEIFRNYSSRRDKHFGGRTKSLGGPRAKLGWSEVEVAAAVPSKKEKYYFSQSALGEGKRDKTVWGRCSVGSGLKFVAEVQGG